jgi:hypothetical protein
MPAPHQKPREAATYIKALENRVAELEMALTNNGGLTDASADHWTQPHQHAQPQAELQLVLQNGEGQNSRAHEGEDGQEVHHLAAVRDVSLNASGFIGGSSTVTLARMLGSILDRKGKEQLALLQETTLLHACIDDSSPTDSRGDFGTSPVDSTACTNALRGIQSNTAERLLSAYFKHVAVNFPLVHSAQVKSIHNRRESLDSPYEESVLNLVYALGGQFLETVSAFTFLTP